MGQREEAREATRRRILDATVTALAELGYRGTTTLEVQRRSGTSRGNLLHHFGSRTELMLAAVDHVVQERLAEAAERGRTPPAEERVEWAVRAIWATFDGPLFYASLELWLAARSDAELRAALVPRERQVGQAIHGFAVELFGEQLSGHPGFDAAFQSMTDSMRGAATRRVLLTRRAEDRLVAEWIRTAVAWPTT